MCTRGDRCGATDHAGRPIAVSEILLQFLTVRDCLWPWRVLEFVSVCSKTSGLFTLPQLNYTTWTIQFSLLLSRRWSGLYKPRTIAYVSL